MTTTVQHRVPISQIIYKVPRTYFQEVVDATLARRGELSQGARESLDSAIRARVRLTGFRDASKADANLLGPQVLALCDLGDDRLAGALLRAWTEVEGELHRTVAEHLEERGIPSPGPNLKDRCFEDCWPVAEWEEQVQQILDKSPDLDGSAVALMVCLASGRAPEGDGADLAVASPVLNEWIEKLTDMKSEDPEWDEIFSFMRIVGEIAEGKAAERSAEQLDQLKSKLPEIAGDFGDELGYLEIDLDPEAWAMKALGSGRRLEDVLVLAGDLGEWLAEYRKIRPQAESRQQEIERQEARADHEKAILAIAREWEAWSMPPEETDDEAPPEGEDADGGEVPDAGAAPADRDAVARLKAELAAAEDRCAALAAERDGATAEAESLRSENGALAAAKASLESHRDRLAQENGDLKEDLARVTSQEEVWRRSYIESRKADVMEDEGEPEPRSVREAISLAERLFPEQLEFALNAKSDKNSPFQRPTEVFDALSWLATTYHHQRTNPGTPPQFDKVLKESCPGWSYKPGQTKTTKQRFDEWYFTSVNGRTYDLDHHLGKGNSHDPQNTIRIAFAWDEDISRVVIGYIGLHQRNRQT